MTRGQDSKANDYEVGYRRPPKVHQFQPGRSGNPRGRRKGARSVGVILLDVVRQKVTVTESGKTRRVPAIEGMLRRLANDALRGEAGAVKLLLALLDRYSDSPETAIKLVDVLAEDREILEQYLKRSDSQQSGSSDASAPSAAKLDSDKDGDEDAV
jgi:Family of unknown function (DUF5681)